MKTFFSSVKLRALRGKKFFSDNPNAFYFGGFDN